MGSGDEMTGKDTVVDAHPVQYCRGCKSAKRKERVCWICRKNCIERNITDSCIMNPVQFEPRENEEASLISQLTTEQLKEELKRRGEL